VHKRAGQDLRRVEESTDPIIARSEARAAGTTGRGAKEPHSGSTSTVPNGRVIERR